MSGICMVAAGQSMHGACARSEHRGIRAPCGCGPLDLQKLAACQGRDSGSAVPEPACSAGGEHSRSLKRRFWPTVPPVTWYSTKWPAKTRECPMSNWQGQWNGSGHAKPGRQAQPKILNTLVVHPTSGGCGPAHAHDHPPFQYWPAVSWKPTHHSLPARDQRL